MISGKSLLMILLVTAGASADVTPEARGVWISASLAASTGETAEQTAERLASHGFNMVLACYEAGSDPLRDLLAACRQHHLETHLWCFRPPVEGADSWPCASYDEAKQAMTAGGACLCEEEYLRACEDKVREIVREYEFDGIHFDEVGFSRPWQSLCDRCRQRFSADTGLAVPDWPNDVIRVAKATPAAIHDLAAWRGEHFDAFIRWRCGRVTDYLRRLCDAARSVRPLVVSYAAMAEQWADPLYYGEDLAELAKVFDFLVPMSYYTQYSMSQGRPEWTAEVCRSLAEWAHQGNPACKVYAGISAYGSDGGWREPLRDTFQRLVAEGALTAEQQQEHLHYTTCREAFESLEWLRSEAKLRPEEYEQLRTTLDERTPTSDEILRAVESVRAARLPGFVFFRYFCMFEDHTQGVIGKDLWPRLQQAFPAPAALPHAR